MSAFIAFALYLCLSALLLIVWPVLKHPTLPPMRKVLIAGIAFLLIVPLGCGLYAWLGVPQMAVLR